MCSWPISYLHLHAAQLAPILQPGGMVFMRGAEVVVTLHRFWHDSSPRRWEGLPGHIWITTCPPILLACVQGDAPEHAMWITPTVLCPWHKQLEKNGRVAPARPQSSSQSRAENSVLSCRENGNLFHPSLGLNPSLEIPYKWKLEEWLKCWLLSQEAWVARGSCLPHAFGGVGGFGCEAQALGAKLRLWVRSQDHHTGSRGGAGMAPGTLADLKPCTCLESKSLEQNLEISTRQRTFCQYFSN